MKTFSIYILFFTYFIALRASDTLKVVAKFEDLNKPYLVKLEIQNNQVIFARPLALLQIDLAGQTETIAILDQAKPYPFEIKDQEVKISLPAENKSIEVYLKLKNKTKIKFTVITAIIDTDTKDGEIKFEDKIYPIGKYPPIPSSGKTNYFKVKYEPPKYFFIWNSLLEDLPISKSMKYADLVIKPDAEKPNMERPPRATEVFTLSYETILNFDTIIEKTKKKTSFKKVTILSYYRTPEYNSKIGAAAFSRHIYGDGIDWFIDENPIDDIMDDLNKDTIINEEDAHSFVNTIIEMVTNREIEPCGTGVYFTKKGASLHYDSRGHLARWGASELWWSDKSLPEWLSEIEKKVKNVEQNKK